ncbi:MAG: radical SAM family heme chaperone HemW, partial [Agathobacter sp.]|nr:radical SAM family heme chaperone HemW [Agathobacter sp.]
MKKNLEIYLHIPFCMKKCDYCDFLSFNADEQTQKEYIKALIRDIRYYGENMQEYQVSTIYIGGGTPSWMNEIWIQTIMAELLEAFDVIGNAEITMECNPGTLTSRKLLTYRNSGINRLSIGLQSADDEELKILGRIHTFDQFLKSYEGARVAGFDNINVDLMSCIPRQNTQKFVNSLNKVIRLKPDHISAYTLIIEKGTPFYNRYKFDLVKQQAGLKPDELPDEDEAYKIYKTTQTILKDAGYIQYETSNFARKGYECKHNIGYWTRENYLGIGLGAASLIENVRCTNTSDIDKYIAGEEIIVETIPIDRKAQMEEFMFLGLRMTKGINRYDFEQTFGVPIEGIYLDQMEELKKDGLLEARAGQIYLSDKGQD